MASKNNNGPLPTQRQVRRTVDLTYEQHTALSRWCSETAATFGTARVTGQDVFRALVDRLLADPLLACQVRADLATQVLARQTTGNTP